MALHLTPAPSALYRIAFLPEPLRWQWPVGPLVESDRPVFEYGRWDAPDEEFASLYCADSRMLAFAETIAEFRPALSFEEGSFQARYLAATSDGAPDPAFDFDSARSGQLPATYFERAPPTGTSSPLTRAIGRGSPGAGRFVDVGHPDTHDALNRALGGRLSRFGFRGFDRGVMMTQDRRITRRVAGWLHDSTDALGISYECRFMEGRCYALWPRDDGEAIDAEVDPIVGDDPDLRRAAELLHIEIAF